MPQLLVRDIEVSVVKQLRNRAAAEGLSVEEAHRRLLRGVLSGDQNGAKRNFLDYLGQIPKGGSIAISRSKDRPRRNEF
mgnify:CR=1 FL=1